MPRPPVRRWILGGVALAATTAALLGLARLLAWLSRAQIDYLAN